MLGRARARNQFWAVAAFGGLAIAVLTATLGQMAEDFDRVALQREQVVVGNGLSSRVDEIGRQVIPQAVWDEAVLNLDNRFNRDWARDNVGTYLYVTNGFQFSWVLNASDRPIYGMDEGADVPMSRFDQVAAPVSRIVAEVRAAEALRASTVTGPTTGPQSAIVANAMDLVGGELFVLSATLVQPDFGTARITGPRAPVIVTGRLMDKAFVDAFGRRYMLKDAHLHLLDSRSDPDQAHAGIANPAGQTVATLDWEPQRAGNWLLDKFLPMTLALLAAMLALALIAYRKAHAATRAVEASERRAIHVAYHDRLTGLGNREALEKRVDDRLAGGKDGGPLYALHCVDLDNFKEINDLSGHAVGDELLRIAARRLRRLAGPGGLCFRLGGDEFALLQPVTDQTQALQQAERILQALSRSFGLSVGRLQLTASVGISLSDPANPTAGELLRKADLALFCSKRDGRARVTAYDPAMDESARRRRGLQDALRRDLEAGALTMLYQPQVDRSRALIGVEALVRWNSAEFGPVSPAVFVPLAEESGMIEALGAFTLKRAFEDSLRWPGLKMAVNISAIQLRDPDFIRHLIALAGDTGVSPSGIELELTEGVLVDRGSGASQRLDELRDAGFSIAIDDFGTGYSSLSYLSRFPIGKIKIDRSFVIDMGQSESADVLVSTIVQLGRSLNMRVIAEGVETPDQWLRLAAAGCNEFQGYLASRPVTAEVIDQVYAGQVVAVDGQDARYAPERRLAAAA
ncbi:MAG: EAL domain-containing protein [Caulobacteraceae bacterium]|nr:EAL domain-containing protein [Caulobacteraceae bacterium]